MVSTMQKTAPILIFLSLLNLANPVIADDHLKSNQPFVLEEATIESIHHAIKNHQLTCIELVNQYLERIQQYNLNVANHAPINAFTEINTNVLEQAKKLDDVFSKTQRLTGTLHCIPVVLKDNIDSYDSTSSSGTLAMLGNQPQQDAFLVSKLRESGAIILGKSGMDELASGMYGINSRNGRIGNAYNPSQNPGGSSGGSAAAVSANFTVLAIGSDNSGSVRIPAAFNGIYGLRPSTGLISQRGIFPAGNLDGTAGPFARTVKDLTQTLNVIAKEDPNDEKTLNLHRVSTYTVYLKKDGLKNKRIGIVRKVGELNTFKSMPNHVTQIINQSLHTMQQSGAIIIDDIKLTGFNNNRDLNMAGMKQDIDAYLASYPSARKNYQDLCESNRTRVYGNMKKCLAFFEEMPPKFGKEYKQALSMFNRNKSYIENIMNQHQLDALLLPISTTGGATYDPYKVNTWQAPIASNAGLPALAINIGYTAVDKMPIGIELIGKQYSEGSLIEIAYGYEHNAPPRIAPNIPAQKLTLEKLDIPMYNNLLTRLGYRSYYEVLIKHQSSKYLTPLLFKNMLQQELEQKDKRDKSKK